MTLGPIPISSVRVCSHNDISGLPGASETKIPRSKCLVLFLTIASHSQGISSGLLSLGPARGEWGLTAGNHRQLIPQSHGCEGSERVGLFFRTHRPAQSPFSFYRWHTFPCLAETLASSWCKGWKWMDDIQKPIQEVQEFLWDWNVQEAHLSNLNGIWGLNKVY